MQSALKFSALLLAFVSCIDANAIRAVNQTVCYDGLGCFSTAPPFSDFGRIALLPQTPEDIGTRFDLYTRLNKEDAQIVKGDSVNTLTASNFNKDVETKIIIHGWNGNHRWIRDMKDQFLANSDCNVVITNWAKNGLTLYAQASADCRVVGAQIAQLVQLMISQGASIDKFHILGHSLGGHICGYAGERLPGLPRITGMDPAQPYFENMDPLVRLDPTDAEFVEVIHTDGGDVFNLITNNGGMGLWQPSGHVDIYPNGGVKQIGCKDNGPIESVIEEGIIDGIRYIFGCNHERGYEYPTEAIMSQCPWRAYQCEGGWDEFKTGRCLHCPDVDGKTCNTLGLKSVKPSDGTVNNMYWLMTGPEAPFCRYHYHIQLAISSKSNKEQKGLVWVKLISGSQETEFLGLGEDNFYIEPAATYNFLVVADKPFDTITSIELEWEHDAAFYEIGQWQWGTPTIIPRSINVFSGEFQTEVRFCDNGNELKSKDSRRLTERC